MSQPPQPPYGYGSMPPPPDGLGAGQAVAAPTRVQRAVQCLYALAVVYVLQFLLSLLSTESAGDAIRETEPTLTEAEVSAVVAVGLIFSAVLTLVFAGLWLLSARKMLGGRSWARILATVITGIILVLGSLSLAGVALVEGADAAAVVLTALGVALSIAFLVLAWTRESNAFFAASARSRA